MIKTIRLDTEKRDQIIDITGYIQSFIKEEGLDEGLAAVYCPHTTAGVMINENADPDVASDVLRRLDESFPWNHTKDLHDEGNSAAHLKAAAIGTSCQLIVNGQSLVLGTWQGVQFCEFDGPRQRHIHIKLLRG